MCCRKVTQFMASSPSIFSFVSLPLLLPPSLIHRLSLSLPNHYNYLICLIFSACVSGSLQQFAPPDAGEHSDHQGQCSCAADRSSRCTSTDLHLPFTSRCVCGVAVRPAAGRSSAEPLRALLNLPLSLHRRRCGCGCDVQH